MTDVSMISALIDELNKSADEWNNSNMFELACMCREAADTIWQLRDDLQRTNAENAKLRELVRELYDSIDSVFWDGEYATRERFKPLLRELGVEVDG